MSPSSSFLLLLVLATAAAAISTTTDHPPSDDDGAPRWRNQYFSTRETSHITHGCTGDDRDTVSSPDEEGLMPLDNSETKMMTGNHRLLGEWRDRYITYRALRANKVPCDKQGNSYYNCRAHKRVNPYTRGCSTVTRCYRWTH